MNYSVLHLLCLSLSSGIGVCTSLPCAASWLLCWIYWHSVKWIVCEPLERRPIFKCTLAVFHTLRLLEPPSLCPPSNFLRPMHTAYNGNGTTVEWTPTKQPQQLKLANGWAIEQVTAIDMRAVFVWTVDCVCVSECECSWVFVWVCVWVLMSVYMHACENINFCTWPIWCKRIPFSDIPFIFY